MCNFVSAKEGKSVFTTEGGGRSVGCSSHPLPSNLRSSQFVGWLQRSSCQVYERGLGLGFCVSFLVLTNNLIPPGTCLPRITCISGMNDLSRWLCGAACPFLGKPQFWPSLLSHWQPLMYAHLHVSVAQAPNLASCEIIAPSVICELSWIAGWVAGWGDLSAVLLYLLPCPWHCSVSLTWL